MTLEEERLRYEAALDMARLALGHLHKAFKMEEKLLQLALCATAMGAAHELMGGVVSAEVLAAQPDFLLIMQQQESWKAKLRKMNAIPEGGATVVPIDFKKL